MTRPRAASPTRRDALRTGTLGTLGLLAWSGLGAAGLLGGAGCAPADGGPPDATPGDGADSAPDPPLGAAVPDRSPADPLTALLDDIVPAGEALVGGTATDEEAWVALVAERLTAMPRLDATELRGPGRLRFGSRRARGPVTVTLVRVEDGGVLPLHDHRDLCSVLFGLSGRLPVRRLQPLAPAALLPAEPGVPFLLRETGKDSLVPGRALTQTRTRDTVHGIRTDGSAGSFLEVTLRFSDTAGSRVLQLDPQPEDPAEGIWRARWA